MTGLPPLPVLMYHSVSRVPAGPVRALAVPPARLAEQLAALVGAGYAAVGLTEALAVRAADPQRRVVAVTFDDGFRDFLTTGLPILDAAGAAATLYVAAGHVGRPASWLGRQATQVAPILTWDEVGEVAAAGVEIGSHALVHTPLDVLPPRVVAVQVRMARDRLRQHTRSEVRSFAYPHGYHSRRVRAVVAGAGHHTACEVGRRLYRGGDPMAIPRLMITPDLTGEQLLTLIRTGGPRLSPAAKDLVRPPWRGVRRVARDLFGVRLT